MNKYNPSCFRFGVGYFCPACKSDNLIKSSVTGDKKQRYKCKEYGRKFVTEFKNLYCNPAKKNSFYWQTDFRTAGCK